MKIGIGTYALAWSIGVPGFQPENPMDIFQFMQFVHQRGISLIQIADNMPLHLLSDNELQKVRAQAQKLRLDVELGTRGLMPENVRKYLDIAAYFGSPILRIVVDSGEFMPSVEKIITIIDDLVPELRRRNLKLAIENHDRMKASDFRTIVENTDSQWVGICLDSVNSIGADEGFDTVFNTLVPLTINLHLKDYIIRRKSHMMGFDILGTPAGKGMMPIPRVIQTLKKLGRTSSIILELWPPAESSINKTIEKEQQWVIDSLEYLNTLEI
jgi:sugar phosphate isomerase/epimerase